MTKAKSKFAKTLLALLVTLALAIAMLGGGLATLGASAAEGEGATLPDGVEANKVYFQIGNTVVTGKYGSLTKIGYEIEYDGESGGYVRYTITMLPGVKFQAHYYCNGEKFFSYAGLNHNWDAAQDAGVLNLNTPGSGATYAEISAGNKGYTVGKIENFKRADGDTTVDYPWIGCMYRLAVTVKDLTENDYTTFGLTEPNTLKVNLMGETKDSLFIDTGISGQAVNNVQATNKDKTLFLNKIKFYLNGVSQDANDLYYNGHWPDATYSLDVNRTTGTNVIYYLKKDGKPYAFKDGDALVLEKGWRLLDNDTVYGSCYQTDAEGKILELDRTYKWIWHYGCDVNGHFGYEATAVKGIKIGADADIVDKAVSVEAGGSVNLKATMYASLNAVDGGSDLASCPADPDGEINGVKISDATWEVIEGAEFASVNAETGVVTAIKKGTAKIKATSKVNTEVSATIDVKVAAADEITNITIEEPAKTTIENREVLTLTTKLTGGSAIEEDGAVTYAWTSSNKAAATVDNTGKVTGVAPGKTTIMVIATSEGTPDGVSAQIEITVTLCPTDVTGVTINISKTTITVGEDLTPTAVTTGGSKKDEATVVWSVSDATVVQIDEDTGALSALKAGKVTLTVTVTAATGDEQTASVEITVNAVGGNDNDDNNNNDDDKKSGCGSSAVGASAVAGIVLLASALAVVASKKKARN